LTLKLDALGARPFRLAIAFALTISAATVVSFALIYFEVAREVQLRVSTLVAEEARLSATVSQNRLRAALEARQTRTIRPIDYLSLFGANGALVIGNLPRLPPIAADGHARRLDAEIMSSLGAKREDAILAAQRRPDGGIVVLGRNLQEVRDIEHSLLRALSVALAPTVAAILVIGGLFARRAARRLADLHGAIQRIIDGQLDSRLPAAADGDEIARIAYAVNLMLDQIVRLLDQLRSVGDNIAHDLRAPLAVARLKIERSLDAAPEAVRQQLEAALVQLDRAAVAITALLRISAVENGPRDKTFQDVDLAAICAQVVELYEPVAESKAVGLSSQLSGPILVRGDEDLLREAIANLVDNAVKFAPAGGKVEVRAAMEEGGPYVAVSDDGPGVAPADRELIFKRFHRGTDDGKAGGHGLGLSIARNICELHGLSLSVEDNAPGARFFIRPAAKARLVRAAS
jgi:signal transduction histidine kinase